MKKIQVAINFLEIKTKKDCYFLSIEGTATPGVEVVCGSRIYDLNTSHGSFLVEIPLAEIEGKKLYFNNGRKSEIVRFGIFSRLANLSGSYNTQLGFLLHRRKHGLIVRRYSWWLHVISELLFLNRIIVNIGLEKVTRTLMEERLSLRCIVKAGLFLVEAVIKIPESLFLRILAKIYRLFNRNSIWILTDRGEAAGDNAEALFEYIMKQDSQAIDVYFALSKKSPDFERVSNIGRVVNIGSIRYKVLFLCASKIISSHADIETTNPFFRMMPRFVDMLSFDFVFLQHGVIRHDHSEWLNRHSKNIKLFITSSYPEYKSMFTYPYFYSKDVILRSGLPRFDYLKSNIEKKIIIAPTYRSWLLQKGTNSKGARPYDPDFKQSSYFAFYSSFMNDDRIKKALKKYGYVIEFYIHPAFEKQRKDFTSHESLIIPSYPYNYRKALSEGALLISDYSSIIVDFVYMKKPIIYTKFDENEFYQGHTYGKSDFFSDRSDGFGPVTETLDELVEATIEKIATGCYMSDFYEERVESFFYTIDQNNSKRVYDAIVAMDNRV